MTGALLLDAAREPDLRRAREKLAEALALDPSLRLLAAPLRFALHDVGGALGDLRALGDPLATRLRVELARRAGFEHEALEAIDVLLPRADDDAAAELHRLGAEMRLHARHWRAAWPHLAALGDAARLARAAVELGDPRSLELARDAGDAALLVELGAFEEAASVDPAWRRLLVRWRVGPATGELAEARDAIERGDDERGRAICDRVLRETGRFHFPALLLRLLSEMRGDLREVEAGNAGREQTRDEGPLQLATEVRAALTAVWGEDRLAGSPPLDEVVRILEETLLRLGGNLGVVSTYVDDDGRLRRVPVRESPREASRWALELVRVAPPEQSLAALDEVRARHPRSESPHAHRGELLLWLGRYEEAEACFREALGIQKGTRWAWIGLGGAQMLRGELEEALATQQRGVAVMGGAIGSAFIYRGEALLRLGRHEEALRDLEAAEAAHPTRLSTWLDLALLHGERGDARAERYLRLLMQHAPMLLEDAGGWWLWGEGGDAMPVLRRARDMLRGNRSSSCVTYFADGRLRTVPRPRLDAPVDLRRDLLRAGVVRRLRRG